MVEGGNFTIHINKSDINKRLDIVVSAHIENCSRSLAADLIKKGTIIVKGTPQKPGYKVRKNDIITGYIHSSDPVRFSAEPVPFRIIFEDDHMIVVNKPPGLVVHPAPGHHSATLVNGLLFHCPDLKGVGGEARPGIVHRLDKDTSGIILIAKSPTAHEILSDYFKNRIIQKEYLALVWGNMPSTSGVIGFDIGRHPSDRKKMSVHSHKGRCAETLWVVKESFGLASLLQLDLKTGRTHQIRVHCAAINHPVLGDEVYGKGRKKIVQQKDGKIKKIQRQMLHAWRIQFNHPIEKKIMTFKAEMPDDMKELIEFLRYS